MYFGGVGPALIRADGHLVGLVHPIAKAQFGSWVAAA